jgi:hypothetical protein
MGDGLLSPPAPAAPPNIRDRNVRARMGDLARSRNVTVTVSPGAMALKYRMACVAVRLNFSRRPLFRPALFSW